MRLALVVAIVAVTALDVATYYLLPARGESEANPIVLALGLAAPIPKLAVAGLVAVALLRRFPYSRGVALLLTAWWAFGAYVNSI